jgi:peptidoglycan/xylan/chitin deacetylase (PgdA/CDA1 family)
MHRTLLYSTAAVVLGLFFAPVVHGGEPAAKPPQIIILKLDDVVAHGTDARAPVPPRWQRMADFVEQARIHAAFGIIGYSLEQDNPAYFDWIKNLHKKGHIEFWNHGYRNRKAEDKTGEFEEPFAGQKDSLEKTQKLAKEKLGIELKVFGAHWSGTNQDTAKALEGIPEITMLFYDPKSGKKLVFERVLTLENPIFVPDAEKFQELYEARAKDKACLALQGHPNSWDEKRWEGFVKIIEYLKSQGCVFMTPSEYLAKTPRR